MPQLVRSEPRITVVGLARILSTRSAIARSTILKDQKRPKEYKTTYYKPFLDAIHDFIAAGGDDKTVLEYARLQILAKPASKDFHHQVSRDNALAMESFMNLLPGLPMDFSKAQPGLQMPPKIIISGVAISLRPEIVALNSGLGGNTVGAAKIFLSKTAPLNIDSGSIVSLLLERFSEEYQAQYGATDPKACIVLDVFNQSYYGVPKAKKQRSKELTAACDEIKAMWPYI